VLTSHDLGVFEIASRFNHACKPKLNVMYHFDQRRDVMVFSVTKDVKAGEELLVSYGAQPMQLYQTYGFRCQCGGCRGVTDAEIEAVDVAQW
jgi:hypothetical protein